MKFPPKAKRFRSGFKHFKRLPYGSRWVIGDYRISIVPPPGYEFGNSFDGMLKLAWDGEPSAGAWMIDPENRWQWELVKK